MVRAKVGKRKGKDLLTSPNRIMQEEVRVYVVVRCIQLVGGDGRSGTKPSFRAKGVCDSTYIIAFALHFLPFPFPRMQVAIMAALEYFSMVVIFVA